MSQKDSDRRLQPEEDKNLGKAKAVEQAIVVFYDQNAGEVNMMLMTPWVYEDAAARMALRAEDEEERGEEPIDPPHKF